jgi:hypothetical protein
MLIQHIEFWAQGVNTDGGSLKSRGDIIDITGCLSQVIQSFGEALSD